MEGNPISEEIKWLACGPSTEVSSYNGYFINGFKFHTKELELRRKTQNSGIMLNANTSSYSSSRDINPVCDGVTYYGVLDDIWELQYGPELKVVLFKCTWYDEHTTSGFVKDKYGFNCINNKKTRHKDDPFILASQAHQCFYIQDPFLQIGMWS